MLIMKLALTTILLATLVGCDQPRSSSYFPLDPGLRWVYKNSYSTADQTWPAVDVFSIENISNTTLINQGTRHHVAVRRTSDSTRYYISDTPTGIKRIAKRSVVELKPRFDLEERVVLPSEQQRKVGHLWNVSSYPYMLRTRPGHGADLGINDFKMAYEITDLNATVEVPAGVFENCLKIEAYASVRLYADPRLGYITVPITQTEWYAPGVGLVKLERDEPMNGAFYVGGNVVMELQEYN